MADKYKKSGVNYKILDPVKLTAQKYGLFTKANIKNSGFTEVSESRGESAYIIESSDCYYAFVTEGLGTKNLVADQISKFTGKSYYDAIAQDTVAAIVNDLITVGAKPLTVSAYWAVGDTLWFNNKKRINDLITGWKKACDLSGATWGGGETPVLKDIINPQTIDLAGSAFGIIKPKNKLILGDKIQSGDDIILLSSNGIHANGLTLARKILNTSKNKSKLADQLLKPTFIYAKIINEIAESGVSIHYLINITGHGWRKLMRANKTFSYNIEDPGNVPELFKILKKEGNLSDREMYATYNMGAGFALIVNPEDTEKILHIAKSHKIKSWKAGNVIKGKKQVRIISYDITFTENDLKLRN